MNRMTTLKGYLIPSTNLRLRDRIDLILSLQITIGRDHRAKISK